MTFRQLCTRLEEEYGCEFRKGEELSNSRGESFQISYVVRNHEDGEISVAIDFGADEEMVNPDVLRSTCRRLKIDVKDFSGYHLG